jgi:hypothetical protein
MKIQLCKTKIFAFFCVLVFVISTNLALLPTVGAQDLKEKTTYAFIGATPNPVGVNQDVLLHVGITDYLEIAEDGWEGLTVTVTDPQGTETVLGPYRSDSTGGTGAVFVPTMVGTYTLQTHFPEQEYTWSEISRAPLGGGDLLYLASTSDVLELVVQDNAVDYYPSNSLPNEYWSRPIDAQLREWWTIAGSWLEGAARGGVVTPYNDGPETAHILWTTELTMGGLVGGDMGEHGMVCGDAYEGKYIDALIIDGILYYNKFEAQGGSDVEQVVVAMDLHTGETVWERTLLDNEQIEFGQTMYWDTMNSHGVYTYLWATSGSTWMAFDAQTGRWVYNITDVPSGTRTFGPNGEILVYSVSNGVLTQWNSTAVYYNTLMEETDNYAYHAGRWRPQGRTFDASYGLDKTIDLPDGFARASAYYVNDRVLSVSISSTAVRSIAVSLEPGKEGTVLLENTWNAPAEWESGNLSVSFAAGSPEDGVFVLWASQTRQFYGFDMDTGDNMWVSDSQNYMDYYAGTNYVIAYGNLYAIGYDGVLYCYEVTTGNVEWSYVADDNWHEILWSNNWPGRIQFVTDGKIYVGMEEHSSVDPKPRGAPYCCIDAYTGDEIWRINGGFRQTHWGGNSIIGDGIIATMNTYDQRIYAVGKGASALTMSVSPTVGTKGTSVQIEGTIMDASPGTDSVELTTRFPNGVPAISDADMSEWMKYVYMQFERPVTATGLTVIFCAVDPDGQYMDIGRTTSDSYGNYAFAFKPEKEGTYQIIATFEGSGAYYGATQTTYLTVDSASASTQIELEEPVDASVDSEEPVAGFITTEVAIIAAVAVAAVIGVAAYWILKRK